MYAKELSAAFDIGRRLKNDLIEKACERQPFKVDSQSLVRSTDVRPLQPHQLGIGLLDEMPFAGRKRLECSAKAPGLNGVAGERRNESMVFGQGCDDAMP